MATKPIQFYSNTQILCLCYHQCITYSHSVPFIQRTCFKLQAISRMHKQEWIDKPTMQIMLWINFLAKIISISWYTEPVVITSKFIFDSYFRNRKRLSFYHFFLNLYEKSKKHSLKYFSCFALNIWTLKKNTWNLSIY